MFACKNIFTPNFNGNVFFRRKTERLYVAEQKFYFCLFQCYNMSEKLSVWSGFCKTIILRRKKTPYKSCSFHTVFLFYLKQKFQSLLQAQPQCKSRLQKWIVCQIPAFFDVFLSASVKRFLFWYLAFDAPVCLMSVLFFYLYSDSFSPWISFPAFFACVWLPMHGMIIVSF